jgi:hypothetical protein
VVPSNRTYQEAIVSKAVNPFGPLIKLPGSEPVEAPQTPAPTAPVVSDAPPADDVVEVPKGTTAEVLEWVDGDKARAAAALAAEEESGQPRKGLVRELNELLEADADGE